MVPIEMTDQHLKITRVHIVEYRRALRGVAGTSPCSAVIRIHAHTGMAEFLGVGAVRPGGNNQDPDSTWAYLETTAQYLTESPDIHISDVASSRDQLIERLTELRRLEPTQLATPDNIATFPNMIAATEQALLEVLVQAHGCSMTDMLGEPLPQFSGDLAYTTGSAEKDLTLLDSLVEPDAPKGATQTPAMLDLRGRMSRKDAEEFTEAVAAGMVAGTMPQSIVLQDPIADADGESLSDLQRKADQATSSAGCRSLDLRIMADGTLPPVGNTRKHRRGIEYRALRFVPEKTGGALESLRLARQARQERTNSLVLVSEPEAAPAYGAHIGKVSRFAWMPKPTPLAEREGQTPNTYDVRFYSRLRTPELDSHLIQREALAYGLAIERTSTKDFVAQDVTGNAMRFLWSIVDNSTLVARTMVNNKQVARMLMQREGVPVPDGRSFLWSDRESAARYAELLGFPVVLKPQSGTGGRGVVSNIQDQQDLSWAFESMDGLTNGSSFIIEKHVEGNDYRIFVLDGRVLSVALRTPANVMGDGQRTVEELAVEKIGLRRQNPHLMAHPIRMNRMAQRELASQNLTPSSVPFHGQRVHLTAVANLAQGGDNIEVTNETHRSIIKMVADGVRAIPGLTQAGVDLLLSDHKAPVDEQVAGICEINPSPAQTANETPLYGVPARISEEIVLHFGSKKGLKLATERDDQIRLRVAFEGGTRGRMIRRRVGKYADAMGLDGWIRNVNVRYEELLVAGPVEHISALLTLVFVGDGGVTPDIVRAVPTIEPVPEGFEVAERKRKEDRPR